MKQLYPIYTEKNECQDCYKCLRQCPVKAIMISDGHASVIEEYCVLCGHCVDVCPMRAKRIRSEISRVKTLIADNKKTIVSLAPSWVSEYKNVNESQMVSALKNLGFYAVSETALGAEIVTESTAKLLKDAPNGIYWSSACPSAVDFIEKYAHLQVPNITNIISPVIAHAKILKEYYGDDSSIVMIGPCIAKKSESLLYPSYLDLCITFSDLNDWLTDEGINIFEIEMIKNEKFLPFQAEKGRFYPVNGGMVEALRHYEYLKDVNFITISGLSNIDKAIIGRETTPQNKVFIEALACEGGCVNGPGAKKRDAGLDGRIKLFPDFLDDKKNKLPKHYLNKDIKRNFIEKEIKIHEFTETDIQNTLRKIGKENKEDELNCGGCGYDKCRSFALARLSGKAEDSMCISYLRKQNQKKANALIQTIPFGVVIVDENLQIIECNYHFAKMFGKETEDIFNTNPGLKGAYLEKILNFYDLFKRVLENGIEIEKNSYKDHNMLLNIHIFNIEDKKVIGALIMDVSKTEIKREQIAERAKKVIHKNLATVQEIACMLGEHMAETEILLRSIAEDYSKKGNDEEYFE